MLIVIVCIGLLAAALIPRFTYAVIRVRHTKRLTDLRQIAGAVQIYQNEHGGKVPAESMMSVDQMVTGLDKYLVPQYMTYMPLDSLYVPSSFVIGMYDSIDGWIPAGEQPPGYGQTPWVTRQVKAAGSYGYIPLPVNGQANSAFALIAAFIDDPEYANWMIYPNSSYSRNIFINYRDGAYMIYSSGAALEQVVVTEASDMKDVLCDRIDTSVRYSMPMHELQPDGSYTCYPANNDPIAVYGYSTRDNYYRYVYIQQ